MIARVTAVIPVGALHVMIVGIKPHGAVAHARIQGQFLRQLPACLQIRVNVPHQVAFVAAFIAFDAIFRHAIIHDEVFVPATIFAHVFVVQTRGESDRHQQFAAMRPAGVHALIVALHVDNAAGVGLFKLRLIRN
ncbi:hypothetical protein D3C76_1065940 [compost metagenome]